MKKAGLILLSILILSIISISLIKAENIPGAPISESDLQKIENITNKIPIDESGNVDNEKLTGWKSKAELRIENINENYIKPILEKLNPIFSKILGVDYSFSWLFLFAVIIWLVLFFIILPIASVLFGKWYFGLIAGFAITSLIGLSGVIRKGAQMISNIITTWWLALICLIITAIIGVLLYFFSESFNKWTKKQKEQDEKIKEKQDKEILHTSAEIEKKKLESYKDGGVGI